MVEIIFGFLVLFLIIFLKGWLSHQWDQWEGAYSRWKEGKPLRRWDYELLLHRAAWKKLQEEKRRMRSSYEITPSLILQPAFRRRFIELGIDEDIKNEISAKHGMVCACCGCKIRLTFNRNVDHIKPKKRYPELEFLYTNLQVLCRPCNAHKSAYDGDDWKEVVAERRKATARRRRQKQYK